MTVYTKAADGSFLHQYFCAPLYVVRMLGVDANLATALRKGTVLPAIQSTDGVLFGVNVKQEPFVLMTLTDDQRFAIDRAKKYALEQSIQNALNKQAAQLHQQDMNSIKRNQAFILLSRIYVGSISFEIGEEEIKKTFSPFGPVKSVALSWDAALQKHKGFAFVEFEVPEAACLALEQMNGFTLAGRNLKVGRPSNAPQTASLEEELRADPSTKTRVYISSVHTELTESDIQTVFEAFGKVASCILYPDTKCPGRHRGFGYIDFESEEAAITAVSSMNCFDLAGQQLRVGRAITPKGAPLPFEMATTKGTMSTSNNIVSSPALAVTSNSTLTKPPRATGSGFSGPPAVVPNLPPPGVFIPTTIGEPVPPKPEPQSEDAISATTASMWDDDDEVPVPAVSTNSEVQEVVLTADSVDLSNSDKTQVATEEDEFQSTMSRVLLLENMVRVEEVDADLQDEVTEECNNYGQVLRVLIHMTPTQDVRIFVQFDRSDDAKLACRALNQRYFAGRVVHAKLYDEEQFQLHELND